MKRKAKRTVTKRRTNAELSAATIEALITKARAELAALGYDDASVESMALAAGLTKGAVYYHFGGKAGLFEAVLRDVQRDIVARIEARAVAAESPVEGVVAGCRVFLDVALDDELRRIALVDGPRVLGWAKWRAIDAEFGLGLLHEGLCVCQAAGHLAETDPRALAHLLSGALNEAVFLIAEAEDRSTAHGEVVKAVEVLVRSVLA